MTICEEKICFGVLFLLFINVAGCKDDRNISGDLLNGAIRIEISINKTKKLDNQHSLLFGGLLIQGKSRKIDSMDLGCIGISTNNNIVSEKVYIDTIADRQTENYRARDNNVTADVYWLFSEDLTEADLRNNLKIVTIGNCNIKWGN
jgi:hypothetical protein